MPSTGVLMSSSGRVAGFDLLLQRAGHRMPFVLDALGVRLEHAQRQLGDRRQLAACRA